MYSKYYKQMSTEYRQNIDLCRNAQNCNSAHEFKVFQKWKITI